MQYVKRKEDATLPQSDCYFGTQSIGRTSSAWGQHDWLLVLMTVFTNLARAALKFQIVVHLNL
jgi:hypothetical protein